MKDQPLILIVDDDPGILELVKDILGAAGYLVDIAASGKEALDHLQAQPYDLVITDMMMPEMSGMELVQYLHLHYPETLIIILTGFASYQDAVAAVRLGAFDYLIKPLEPEILRHTIERALEYQRLCRSQHDLEVVFQGAEALGWQALELVLSSPEAEVLKVLRGRVWSLEDLKGVGRLVLEAARDLMKTTRCSIFLFDAPLGQFTRLAALGPEPEPHEVVTIPAMEGIMSYVAHHRRPLLVPHLSRDSRFLPTSRRSTYRTDSFMIIPLTGYKFWGVVNFTDREDGQSFTSRDLFLGWLLGRLLVELLESREKPEEISPLPSLAPWVREEVPLGLALMDENLKVIQANPALEQLAGFKGRSLVGQKIFSRLGFSPQDQEYLEAACGKALLSQKPQEFPPFKTSPRGKAGRYLGVKILPSPSERDGSQGLLLVEDVSELEQLKQRLRLYEHLAVMGKLTLCVAHELNNPLDGIRRYLSLALLKKEEPQEVERYLVEAQKAFQRMSLSIKSLLFTANPQKAPPKTVDNLLNLLHDAVKIMMFQASDQQVEVTFHTPPQFQKLVTEADLYYVFINIIKNALQAMPQGGHLLVDGFLEQDQVGITFQDTGAGVSPQELDKILQPFYTSKEGSQGLGLGLPICQKILERYGGRLEVTSTPGQGTKVSVILPYASPGGHDGH